MNGGGYLFVIGSPPDEISLVTHEVVTPGNRATSAPEYPGLLAGNQKNTENVRGLPWHLTFLRIKPYNLSKGKADMEKRVVF